MADPVTTTCPRCRGPYTRVELHPRADDLCSRCFAIEERASDVDPPPPRFEDPSPSDFRERWKA